VFVELWFLGQGYYDHLEKGVSDVPNEDIPLWHKLDFQLYCFMGVSLTGCILTRLANYISIDSLMDPNQKLTMDQHQTFSDPERQMRLMGKLIHLNITRPNISYVVGVVSLFMQNPHIDHWNVVIHIHKRF